MNTSHWREERGLRNAERIAETSPADDEGEIRPQAFSLATHVPNPADAHESLAAWARRTASSSQ